METIVRLCAFFAVVTADDNVLLLGGFAAKRKAGVNAPLTIVTHFREGESRVLIHVSGAGLPVERAVTDRMRISVTHVHHILLLWSERGKDRVALRWVLVHEQPVVKVAVVRQLKVGPVTRQQREVVLIAVSIAFLPVCAQICDVDEGW